MLGYGTAWFFSSGSELRWFVQACPVEPLLLIHLLAPTVMGIYLVVRKGTRAQAFMAGLFTFVLFYHPDPGLFRGDFGLRAWAALLWWCLIPLLILHVWIRFKQQPLNPSL